MRRFIEELKDFSRKGDWILLILCLLTAFGGLVVIASATNAPKFEGNLRYILIQFAAIVLGIMMYAVVSSIDVESLQEHRGAMVVLSGLLPCPEKRAKQKPLCREPGTEVLFVNQKAIKRSC